MPTISSERSRQAALIMLLNAISALDRDRGASAAMAASLWIKRATDVLRNRRARREDSREQQVIDWLLATACRELTRRADERRPGASARRRGHAGSSLPRHYHPAARA